jgi:hypothetical protein
VLGGIEHREANPLVFREGPIGRTPEMAFEVLAPFQLLFFVGPDVVIAHHGGPGDLKVGEHLRRQLEFGCVAVVGDVAELYDELRSRSVEVGYGRTYERLAERGSDMGISQDPEAEPDLPRRGHSDLRQPLEGRSDGKFLRQYRGGLLLVPEPGELVASAREEGFRMPFDPVAQPGEEDIGERGLVGPRPDETHDPSRVRLHQIRIGAAAPFDERLLEDLRLPGGPRDRGGEPIVVGPPHLVDLRPGRMDQPGGTHEVREDVGGDLGGHGTRQ